MQYIYNITLKVGTDQYKTIQNNIDLIQYTEYLQNYKPPEGVNLGYEGEAEQLIKMPLPKRLQKDSLSKPIKLSKLETQTNKMLT